MFIEHLEFLKEVKEEEGKRVALYDGSDIQLGTLVVVSYEGEYRELEKKLTAKEIETINTNNGISDVEAKHIFKASMFRGYRSEPVEKNI